jgi:hypothetical protein
VRTGPLAVAGWVVAATLTLGVSWSAVQVVRGAVAPEELTVADGLPVPTETATGASPSPTATRPSPSPSPSATAPAGRTVTGTGTGGTVVVRCRDGAPVFVSRIPRSGFTVQTESPVEVRFRSDGHRTDMEASCAGTTPRVRVKEDDRGGGDDDDSGPGGDDDDDSGPGGGDDD